MKEDAIEYIKKNVKGRFVRDPSSADYPDPSIEYYVEPWVALKAIDIALENGTENKV